MTRVQPRQDAGKLAGIAAPAVLAALALLAALAVALGVAWSAPRDEKKAAPTPAAVSTAKKGAAALLAAKKGVPDAMSHKPDAMSDKLTSPKLETATFGAGCFWGVEAAFREVKGVKATAVGFMGGTLKRPSYEAVCRGNTGHAEATQVQFDPSVVSYGDLLKVFWDIHDPTTPNRQGPDEGYQYRSVIFYHSPAQKAAAEASRDALQRTDDYRGKRIVTAIEPAATFWRAEEYHQRYNEKHGMASCPRPRASSGKPN
jgi:peptide-methionine (S)-S-oxide reductase